VSAVPTELPVARAEALSLEVAVAAGLVGLRGLRLVVGSLLHLMVQSLLRLAGSLLAKLDQTTVSHLYL
jgi:hypothetical protein